MAKNVEEQIRSLLKKAQDGESGSSQAEVEQALAYAQKLMEKHNLEMADLLEAEKRTLGDNDMGEETAQMKAKLEVFEKRLAWVVSDLCNVRWYYGEKTILNEDIPLGQRGRWQKKTRLVFYGVRADVAAARVLYLELVVVTRVMARHALGKKWTQKHWHYCRGFAAALREKARELKEAAEAKREKEQEKNPGTALMVLKDQLIEQYAKNKLNLATARSRGHEKTSAEFMAGVADGREYDLQKPNTDDKVGGNSQGRLN